VGRTKMSDQKRSAVDEFRRKLKGQEALLRERFKVKELGIFGSYVRGEQNETSDVDILVEFYEPISLFAFMDLEEHLKKLLGMNVDLVSKRALKPRIGKHIMKEVVYL
jgi:predicted nucleotidyltransferase